MLLHEQPRRQENKLVLLSDRKKTQHISLFYDVISWVVIMFLGSEHILSFYNINFVVSIMMTVIHRLCDCQPNMNDAYRIKHHVCSKFVITAVNVIQIWPLWPLAYLWTESVSVLWKILIGPHSTNQVQQTHNINITDIVLIVRKYLFSSQNKHCYKDHPGDESIVTLIR